MALFFCMLCSQVLFLVELIINRFLLTKHELIINRFLLTKQFFFHESANSFMTLAQAQLSTEPSYVFVCSVVLDEVKCT